MMELLKGAMLTYYQSTTMPLLKEETLRYKQQLTKLSEWKILSMKVKEMKHGSISLLSQKRLPKVLINLSFPKGLVKMSAQFLFVSILITWREPFLK
jgi:hypothetical protein